MKKWILLYFISLVVISHLILPFFHEEDFLFFSKWNMFSGTPRGEVFDITWDNGKTYLFKDFQEQMKVYSINSTALFNLVQSHSVQEVRTLFKAQIKLLCQCDNIELVKIDSTLYQYFFTQKNIQILNREQL